MGEGKSEYRGGESMSVDDLNKTQIVRKKGEGAFKISGEHGSLSGAPRDPNETIIDGKKLVTRGESDFGANERLRMVQLEAATADQKSPEELAQLKMAGTESLAPGSRSKAKEPRKIAGRQGRSEAGLEVSESPEKDDKYLIGDLRDVFNGLGDGESFGYEMALKDIKEKPGAYLRVIKEEINVLFEAFQLMEDLNIQILNDSSVEKIREKITSGNLNSKQRGECLYLINVFHGEKSKWLGKMLEVRKSDFSKAMGELQKLEKFVNDNSGAVAKLTNGIRNWFKR